MAEKSDAPPSYAQESRDEHRDDNRGIALFVCMAASLVEFASLADLCRSSDSVKCSDSHPAFGLACGVASAVFCLVRLVLIKVKPDMDSRIDVVLSLFLAVWWAVGTAMNTSSKGPLIVAGNGYFGTWFAFFAAVHYMLSSVSQLKSLADRFSGARSKGLLLLFVTSVVEVGVAADYYHQTADYHMDGAERRKFALAVGSVSAFVCIVQLIIFSMNLGPSDLIGKIVGTFLLAWWSAGAAVNTSSKGPFNSTCNLANGYFSSWMGFFAAVYFCFYAHYPTEQDTQAYNTLP